MFIIGVLYRWTIPSGKGIFLKSRDHELYPYHYLRGNQNLDQFVGERALKISRRCAWAAYRYFIGSTISNPKLWKHHYESVFLPKEWGVINHEYDYMNMTPDGDYLEIEKYRKRYSIDTSGFMSQASSIGYSIDTSGCVSQASSIDFMSQASPIDIKKYRDRLRSSYDQTSISTSPRTPQLFKRGSKDKCSKTCLLYRNDSKQDITLLRLMYKNNGEIDFSWYKTCDKTCCIKLVFITPIAYYTTTKGFCNKHGFHLVGEIHMYDVNEYCGGSNKVLICTRKSDDVGDILCGDHHNEMV